MYVIVVAEIVGPVYRLSKDGIQFECERIQNKCLKDEIYLQKYYATHIFNKVFSTEVDTSFHVFVAVLS